MKISIGKFFNNDTYMEFIFVLLILLWYISHWDNFYVTCNSEYLGFCCLNQ